MRNTPTADDAEVDLRAAAATWNNPDESLESVNARIHDGVPLDKLSDRADRYVNDIFRLFPCIRLPQRPHCLEIGSGTGCIMEAVNRALSGAGHMPASIIGLDIAENMLARAGQSLGDRPPFRFLHYDGVTVPLPDTSVDFIYSVAALQHVPKPFVYNLFFEIHRLLTPTGFATIHLLSFDQLPYEERTISWRDEIRQQISQGTGHWHHFYSRAELEAVLKFGTGFLHVDIQEEITNIWACVHNQAAVFAPSGDPASPA
ncbi:MAG TPA: class I SAM-dependent methyltransferase [Steroidobacteraceae bacterium]|jgi:ubiquinone/menaquinone biosynthesis C-methylase UbiE|nr:class I SAM-dependent methyltransferase [Steroidobacteraceae bacterium]